MSVSVRTYNKLSIVKIVWYPPMIRKINQWKRVQGPERKTAMPGASVRNPAHGKGHEEGSPTKRKGMIWLQGFPLSFPEHVPPKTRVGLILLYCAFHSSDVLWKKLTQGFSLLHLKGVFQLKPLGWLSNLPYLDFYNYACDCL